MISVIFGAGGQGREAMDLLLKQGLSKAELRFCESQPTQTSIHGIEIISSQELINIKMEISWIHIAVGNPIDRKRIVDEFEVESLPFGSIQSKNSSISDYSNFGYNSYVSDFCFIGPDVEIGNAVLINYMASVSHDVAIGDFVTLGPGARINGHVLVGNDVTVGSNVVIKNGTKSKPIVIGNSSTIGAGAVVTQDVPEASTVVGNPARPIN